MMKIFYLNFVPEYEKGVIKKIIFQKKALESLKNKVKLTYLKNNKFYIENKLLGKYNCGTSILEKLFRKYQLYTIYFKLKNKKIYENIDLVYMRYARSDIFLLKYFEYLKKINKKIIIEIPTYPYDKEEKNNIIFVKLDKRYRLKLEKYVDYVVTYSEDKFIWNIPCINISNGIDLTKIKLTRKKIHEGINFISVSNHSYWHGIDRFLYSILKYLKENKNESLKFHIVGNGKETNYLKSIVKDNSELNNIVIFHGIKLDDELDEIYNTMDIAVGSLGRFRSGLTIMKSLKNREYCAKGLPMIYSEIDLDFEGQNFVYKVSHDESLIDIEKVIEWYKNLKILPNEIREYSKQFSWDIQMKKVLDEIKGQ